MLEDFQLLVPSYFKNPLNEWLATHNAKLVRASFLDSENDLPIYIIGTKDPQQ